MKVVAVISATGGAGATTTVANLSAALALQKRPMLAVDFCPENLLRLHFGMAWEDRSGLATQLLQGKDWHEAAYCDVNEWPFVPFGALDDEDQLERLAHWMRERPHWFKSQLGMLQIDPDAIVVCDCPLTPAALREQVLAAADMVLLVCAPDTPSYARATRIVNDVQAAHGPRTYILLNGFDPGRRLDRDIALLLRAQYKKFFSPVIVHRDESLRESLACKQVVFEFAPSSQAAYDFSALATWTLARLGQGTMQEYEDGPETVA